MRKYTLLLSLIILTQFSCTRSGNKNDKYAEARKVYKEAIQVHDEVMPLMGNIMKLQRALKEKRNTISDAETLQEINDTLQDLENAHNSMMVWMRNIVQIPEVDMTDKEADASGLPLPQEMLKIQEKSLSNIRSVETAISESIEQADVLLSRLN